MAKTIAISIDNGSNWYVFPGNKGEMNREGADINDTIFGQSYKSSQTGLIGWTVDANGLYKGFGGYVAELKKSGSTTAMTDEAMTLVSGKTYKITDATKNMWDRSVTPTFEDNNVAINSSNIESIDFLFGRVTFTSGYSVTGPITVATGSYLAKASIAKANAFTLTQTTNPVDNSDFDTVQANSGHRTFQAGLKTVSLAVNGIYATSNAFEALLAARSECIIEIGPDGSDLSVARGFFKPMQTGQAGEVGELETATLNFGLSVPDQANVVTPFKWNHESASTLNTAIKNAITSWQNDTAVDVRYLFDGTNGFKGDAVITDLTLSGGLEAMNEFAVKFQGTGATTVVP